LLNKEYFDDAVWLVSRKREVAKFNRKKFKALKSPKYWIEAEDIYTNSSDRGKKAEMWWHAE